MTGHARSTVVFTVGAFGSVAFVVERSLRGADLAGTILLAFLGVVSFAVALLNYFEWRRENRCRR